VEAIFSSSGMVLDSGGIGVREEKVRYTYQLNVRLSRQMLEELERVSEYRGLKKGTLVRLWIRDRLDEITRSRAYQSWLEEKALEERSRRY